MQFRNVKSRMVMLSVMLLGAMLVMASPASAQTTGSTVTDGNGAFALNITVPVGTPTGTYRLAVTCTGISYPVTELVLTVSDTTPVPGQTITVSNGGSSTVASRPCKAATSVSYTITFLSVANGGGFSIAQVDVIKTANVLLFISPAGTGSLIPQNPFGTGLNLFGGQVPVVQQPSADRGPIVINNNNSSSSSSSAAAAAGGSGVVAPPAQQLVRTGVDALPMAAAGAAIILLGFILLTAGNRTRPAFGTFAE